MTNEKDEFIAMSEEELDQAAGGRRIVRVVGSPYGYGGIPGYGVPAPYMAPAAPVIAAPAPVLSPYTPYANPYGYGYGMRLGTAL